MNSVFVLIYSVKNLKMFFFINQQFLSSNFSMSKKFVLIPLRTFTDLCSSVKKQGDTITGTVKSFIEHEPKKCKKKRLVIFKFFDFNFY